MEVFNFTSYNQSQRQYKFHVELISKVSFKVWLDKSEQVWQYSTFHSLMTTPKPSILYNNVKYDLCITKWPCKPQVYLQTSFKYILPLKSSLFAKRRGYFQILETILRQRCNEYGTYYKDVIVPNEQMLFTLHKLLATQYVKQILYAICVIIYVTV